MTHRIDSNLSSEDDWLMNITIKGVEVGRYRLRKKLKLAPESGLVDFMINSWGERN